MHELFVNPDGTPTNVSRQVSHGVDGLGTEWVVSRIVARRSRRAAT
ncbi:hypothetical protein [Mycobacterium sp.]|nr:hypothetical protein [Mycobacterium sp.]HTQ21319.1 hypothetical protein [Mycobacterium sp.]